MGLATARCVFAAVLTFAFASGSVATTCAAQSASESAPAAPPPQASPDPERPVVDTHVRKKDKIEVASGPGLWLDVGLGIGASLWLGGGDNRLYKPAELSLNIGYALGEQLAIIARGSTWLKTSDLANEFLGAGVAIRFLEERIYIATTLGLGLTRVGTPSEWRHYVQGLALQVDIAQAFPLSVHTHLAVGAHFQFGTPWGGKEPDAFTSLAAGLFVAFGLR